MNRNSITAASQAGTDLDRPTNVRFQVVGLLALAAISAYIARSSVSVAESTIRGDLGLSLRESGWFMGAFFWSYALLQVPSGSFAQSFGTRFSLTLLAALWSTATLGIAIASGFWILLVSQLMMGAAQAGLFPASCYSISHWIPLSWRSLACASLSTGMQIGAITASLLTGPLILAIGWRMVFVCYAIPGFCWAVLFWLRFRNRPQEDPAVNDAERQLIVARSIDHSSQSETKTPTPWGKILLNRSVWFLCGQQACRAGGYMFFASWFPTFLQETHGVSVKESGYLQSLVFTGSLTGSICGGLLTDWIWRRTESLRLSRSGVGMTFLTVCALLILSAWSVDSTVLGVGLLALGAFSSALCGPSAYSAAIDLGGEHVPQVFGLMNMSGNLATAACPILLGELFSRTNNWQIALLAFVAIYLIGAACWAGVDSRRGVSSIKQ